ncbi:hypothetical protein E2C01_102349 [Portunus trituberculatus]|uniref:Uncharacterized protein n=1 Tax=Portunus trituberculatus TaxID=210409 RepID=A0A5B7KI55_PORTR|nr:hypothetical protein [Portunus trituberculatus]
MRLYHNISRSHQNSSDLLCNLYCRYPHLDLCLVTRLYPLPPQDAVKEGHHESERTRGRLSLHQDTKGKVDIGHFLFIVIT